jgi:hypothetical protein
LMGDAGSAFGGGADLEDGGGLMEGDRVGAVGKGDVEGGACGAGGDGDPIENSEGSQQYARLKWVKVHGFSLSTYRFLVIERDAALRPEGAGIVT